MSATLANEGEAMGHCLSATAVKLSETSIWSVQVVDGDRVKRILTVAIDIESRVVTQARGRFNSNPDRESQGPAVNAGGGTRFKVKLDERYKYLMGALTSSCASGSTAKQSATITSTNTSPDQGASPQRGATATDAETIAPSGVARGASHRR